VPALLGAASMYDVAVGLHTGKIGWDAPRRLVPVLFQVAEAGDAVAVDLVRRQAGEVCVMALTAIRRLGLDDEATPVVLGGGVLAARDPLLISEITRRLADEAPRAEPRVIDIPPVAGAAMLGLDHIGAPLSAQARLRDPYLRGAARP
jgi:N-acetylglucosamine kinase-like BadF-type ATPase